MKDESEEPIAMKEALNRILLRFGPIIIKSADFPLLEEGDNYPEGTGLKESAQDTKIN